ncbi:MAG: aldo/keto reductase [Spirochaetes bacterium]|nr:aldo/keto reductase [Spirochaetota bacterium]
MEYIKLGKSDLNVSRVILGTWAIGGTQWGDLNKQDAVKAVETAIDNGMNCIDTAPAYGEGRAEELIGGVIRNRRESIILATKCGLDFSRRFSIDLSKEFINKDLDNSLKRLDTDYIDLYQCHWPDRKTPIEETMHALLELQQKGKIRYFGVSNFSAEQIAESARHADIVSLQPQYSLLDRGIESGIQDICVEKDIAIISYGSLGAGILTGKYEQRPAFDKKDARNFFYRFFSEKHWPKVAALVEEMKKMAEEKGTSPGHLAIAWLLSRDGVAATLAGARTPEQVLDNCEAVNLRLSEEELAGLTALSDSLNAE